MAQNVLDILGADVPGSHDLFDRARDSRLSEELDQESEADAFAIYGARASREDPEVVAADRAEACKGGR